MFLNNTYKVFTDLPLWIKDNHSSQWILRTPCFSNVQCVSSTWISDYRFWFSGSGVGPGFCISKKLPGAAAVAGTWATLWMGGTRELIWVHWHLFYDFYFKN